jgi:hypothetical protein
LAERGMVEDGRLFGTTSPSMKKIVLIFSSALLALSVRGTTIVFDDLGTPPLVYDPNNAYLVDTFPLENAAQFVAGASGNLATVDLGLTYRDSGMPGAVNVYLYGDASGSPDNTNQIFLGSGTPTTQFGSFPATSLVSFAVAGTIPVTMGTTYWLVLKSANNAAVDTWNFSFPPVLGRDDFSTDDSTWMPSTVVTPFTGTVLPAFRITAQGAGVPDSGSTIMLMLGSTAGLLVLRRPFRSQSV